MDKNHNDYIDIDPRPGMVAVACIVAAVILVIAALCVRCVG